MKKTVRFLFYLLMFFAGYFFYLSKQKYHYPTKNELDFRINYLKKVIEEPFSNDSKIVKIGKESKEWMLFSYSFSTYAFTNIAKRDSTYKKIIVPIIKEAIIKSQTSFVRNQYQEMDGFHIDSFRTNSVLYLGHLNLMMGCYRMLSEDTRFNAMNDSLSFWLYNKFSNAPFLTLESYPSNCWIPDNTVALASLKIHSFNTKSNYELICKKWIEYAKQNFVERETGVLFSKINKLTGIPNEEPRGSMLGWSILFISQFDKDFALELYNNYKKHFSADYFIFRLFKERFNNNKTNLGDIDSGPIIYGYSIPANEFALGSAVIFHDFETANQLNRLIYLGAKSNIDSTTFSYKTRFIDFEISPLAEAMVLNGLTMTSWIDS